MRHSSALAWQDVIHNPFQKLLVGNVSFIAHVDQSHYLVATDFDTKIYKLDTHKVVKELDCEGSPLVVMDKFGEQIAVGCENQIVYLFRKFIRIGKIRVEDDILSLHFVDSFSLVCG